MIDVEFESFGKVPRFNREVLITEKIDGTNAQVFIGEDGEFRTGSRKRWIEPGDDNFGFAAWAYERRDALTELLGPGRHFGEWWGKGIQRGYGLDDRRFSLFPPHEFEVNPDHRIMGAGCDVYVVPSISETSGLDVSPSYAIGVALHSLRESGSLAAPGYGNPEGVMVFHTASRQLYKATLVGDEKPKSRA